MELEDNSDSEAISEFALAVINGTHPKYINTEEVPNIQSEKYLMVSAIFNFRKLLALPTIKLFLNQMRRLY